MIQIDMEMPKKCDLCPLQVLDADGHHTCAPDTKSRDVDIEIINGTKAAFCPLLDVPDINAGKWISVKDRLPESAGVATLVTAVNTHGQKCVFEAFLGYGDMHWYTLDTTKMQKHGSNRVDSCWTITHWTEMPEPAEDEA